MGATIVHSFTINTITEKLQIMRQTWAKKVKHINYACTAGLVCRHRYLIVHHLNHSKIIFKYKQMLIFLVLDL
jgi:hypothetical protein